MDLIQAIYAIQKFIFDMMAVFRLFKSDEHMSASAKAQCLCIFSDILIWFLFVDWNSFFLLVEVLVISLIATHMLHPKKNAIFDKYQRANRKIVEISTSSPFTSIVDFQP